MSNPRSPIHPALLGATVAALLLATTPAMAQSAAHVDHATHATATHADATPALPPDGQRWATDAPLRDGMRRIRQAVGALEHLQHGHGSPAVAPVIADQIQSAVNDMIAHCELAPDADAALHGLLVKFIAGAQAVRTGPVTADVLTPMQEALAQYPLLFDDSTWAAAAD